MTAYVDASVLVKLVVAEDESEALGEYLTGRRLATSRIGLIEVRRAVRRSLGPAIDLQGGVFDEIAIIEADAEIADAAATLLPTTVRTLDAIHAATALALGSDLEAFVTYDDRLAEAARGLDLPVVAPRP